MYTEECRTRFAKLVEKEKEAEREKRAPPPESETEVEDKDDEAHGFIFRGEEVSEEIPPHLSEDDKKLYKELFIDEVVPPPPEPSAPAEPAATVSGVAILPQLASRCSEL